MLFRLRVATALAGDGGKWRWNLEASGQELVAEQRILSRLAGKVAWSNDLGHQFGVDTDFNERGVIERFVTIQAGTHGVEKCDSAYVDDCLSTVVLSR